MADDARQSLPDLGTITPPDETYDFFELLRQLEGDGRLFGHSGRPDHEPARLGQHVRLDFALSDVVAVRQPVDNSPARVTVANLGLMGPEGPLPIHLTRWVLDRLSQRWFAGAAARETSDTTFVDFANILQHRMIALFYRAWADAHPAVQVERKVGGRVRSMLETLSGIGLPGMLGPKSSELYAVKLRQAPALAHQVEGPERLTRFLAEALNVSVQLKEFVGVWTAVPAKLQTRLGSAYAALCRGATIGPRIFQRQSRIELRVGPVALADYEAFLPGGKRLELLRTAVRELVGDVLDVDVRIVLARQEIPAAKLGTARLARTTWLPQKSERADAEDLLMRVAVGWRPEMAEAA
ncbi:type VI secretion system baseplate subunit TssG [Mesorhizobium sp. YR577]|uniref:type VI secretion system baseplate subunit TssG n=1 Tax=Mesorhizobium sp. YR577 TaxID=1884373 RepID=UPI0008F373F3|nr:type VI secretion system baseplate subunit TssG [Mesorhizobium sp. YR577]SFT71824.1 type VI secretion system protein ImpH [Mesorhizobium sp. YR577]